MLLVTTRSVWTEMSLLAGSCHRQSTWHKCCILAKWIDYYLVIKLSYRMMRTLLLTTG